MEASHNAAAPGYAGRSLSPIAAAGPCDVCGSPTMEIHCKIICWTCGYTRDCSDP